MHLGEWRTGRPRLTRPGWARAGRLGSWASRLSWLDLQWLVDLRKRRVGDRLLRDGEDNEVIVDEVYHHWVVHVPSILEVLGAVVVFVAFLLSAPDVAWLLLVAAVGLLGHAAWMSLVQFMDVFVITDLRVVRVSGILSLNQASTPLTRILDITVEQPLMGRLLRYGHFVFESAAQDQGLRDIRYVARPLERDQKIQGMQMRLLRRSRKDRPVP